MMTLATIWIMKLVIYVWTVDVMDSVKEETPMTLPLPNKLLMTATGPMGNHIGHMYHNHSFRHDGAETVFRVKANPTLSASVSNTA